MCVCLCACVRMPSSLASVHMHGILVLRLEIVMQKSVFCLFVFSFLHLGCS